MKIKKLLPIILSVLVVATISFVGIASLVSKNKTDSNDSSQNSSSGSSSSSVSNADNSEDSDNTAVAGTSDISSFVSLKNKDIDTTYDSSSTVAITLNGSSASCDSSAVTIDGRTITITDAGDYLVSGTLDDGQIIIAAEDTDDVRIILSGADITCSDSAPIYSQTADKVIITLDSGTSNSITDGSSYTYTDETNEEPNAAIFSKTDLSINGDGSLTVNANFNNGIVSKDDLKIVGAEITVYAVNNGIKGKDSVTISEANIIIECGGDGIESSNTDETDKGYINILSGTISITSDGDGIQGANTVVISDGTIDITSGGGSSNGASHTNSNSFWGGSADTSSDTASTKGIKCSTELYIDGGTITINSADDAIHSDDAVYINGGTVKAATGDDGVHADNTLTVSGGSLTLTSCYEGLEAAAITINGGDISITATDDGINASDGSSSDNMMSGGSATLVFNGGSTYVNAAGDGLDSNGSIVLTGGVVAVDGPSNSGNGGLDYDSTFNVSGGYLIVAGSTGMAQSISTSSTQCGALVGASTTAGTTITIADENDNVIMSYTPSKTSGCIVISSPELTLNSTYTVYTGGTLSGSTALGAGISTGGTISGGATLTSYEQSSTVSGSTGMGGNMGGMGGGGRR